MLPRRSGVPAMRLRHDYRYLCRAMIAVTEIVDLRFRAMLLVLSMDARHCRACLMRPLEA